MEEQYCGLPSDVQRMGQRIDFLVPGSPDQASGGYAYDRRLQSYLIQRGLDCRFLDIDRRDWERDLGGRLVLVDELGFRQWNKRKQPICREKTAIGLVHHLSSSEPELGLGRRSVGRLEAKFLRSIDGIITTNANILEDCRRLRGGSFPRECIAPPAVGQSPAPSRPPADGGRLKILFAGSLIPRKGLHHLLNALTSLDEPYSLQIVGSDSWAPGYATRTLNRASRLSGEVAYLGHVRQEELRGLMEQADILCVPSSLEGFGMVYLEAMTAGLAVLGAAAGGAPSFIEHGRNGFLFRSGDVEGLRGTLARLARDRDELRRIALAGYRTAAAWPTWDEVFAGVYEFLVGEGPKVETSTGGQI